VLLSKIFPAEREKLLIIVGDETSRSSYRSNRMGSDVLKEVRSRGMFWKLILATVLATACPSKSELPGAAKRMAGERANPLIMIGNGAASGRIMQRFGGGLGGGR